MNSSLFKFGHRTASNTSDKRIADLFNKGPMFDVDLITSDEKKVSAHRFVLSLFSKYFATQSRDAGFHGLLIIPLNYPFEIVQKVVQLMYFREVNVPADLKSKMQEALKALKIDDVTPTEPEQQQFKKPIGPLSQHQIVPAAKKPPSAFTQLPQQQQKPVQQPQLIRNGNGAGAKGVEVDAYIPGKRKRAQSTYASFSVRDPDLVTAARTGNAVGSQNVAALARNFPHLNITKVPSQLQCQQQSPSDHSSPTTQNAPQAKQSNVGSTTMVKKLEPTCQPTPTVNNGMVNQNGSIQNVAPTMPTPNQMVSPSPNVQPQNAVRPLQPQTFPNISASITIHKVASKSENSNVTDEQLDQMETDKTRFEDEEMVHETDDEEEESDGNEGTVNGNVEQNDLRDIFPELRDTETY